MSKSVKNTRPRILVLTSTLPQWLGDPEPRFVLDLARAISSRFETVILAPISPGAKVRETMEDIDIRRFRYAPFRRWERLATPGAIMPNIRARPFLALLIPTFFLCQILAIIKLLRLEKFDAVHCHWILPQGLALRVASLFFTAPPYLVTCHGADAFTLNTFPMRIVKRWILRNAGAITVVSQEIRDFLKEHLNQKYMQHAHHIPMGVDFSLFRLRPDQPQSDVPTILFVGRLCEKKGLEYLFRALTVKTLRQRPLEVRIIGDGPLRDSLKKLAHKLGLADKVFFIGSMPHDQLSVEFARATLFCAPSVVAKSGDREGTPTVILEAAAVGLPIVASDVGGCRDIVKTGHSGWLVAPKDFNALSEAIEEALDIPEKTQKMASGARNKVGEFSWSFIGKRYGEIIDLLINASACYEYKRTF